MSTLAVSPFFVENVSEIQLNALKLVTCVSLSTLADICINSRSFHLLKLSG